MDPPTYGRTLRQFVERRDSKGIIETIKRLAAEQSALEQRWAYGRTQLKEARVDSTKLREYDTRVLKEAHTWANELSLRLIGLGVPSLQPADHIKFLQFLSDLVSD